MAKKLHWISFSCGRTQGVQSPTQTDVIVNNRNPLALVTIVPIKNERYIYSGYNS